MSNNYEEKKQARIDRYRERAAKANEESSRQQHKAHDIISGIPPGQPILVGHHSEKAHRRALEKSDTAMRKSFEASEKATYYEEKAQAAESNTAISSDDPKALEKLQNKLKNLEEDQENMKKLNAYYRKNKTCVGFKGLSDEKARKIDTEINTPGLCMSQPCPSYMLSNNNANIRSTRQRIERLQKVKDGGFVGWKFDGGEVVANAEENRLQIYFDEKPDADKRTAMKGWGFKYSKYNNHAWQRQLNHNAIYAAGQLDFIKPLDGRKPSELQPRVPKNKGLER